MRRLIHHLNIIIEKWFNYLASLPIAEKQKGKQKWLNQRNRSNWNLAVGDPSGADGTCEEDGAQLRLVESWGSTCQSHSQSVPNHRSSASQKKASWRSFIIWMRCSRVEILPLKETWGTRLTDGSRPPLSRSRSSHFLCKIKHQSIFSKSNRVTTSEVRWQEWWRQRVPPYCAIIG